MLPHFEDDTALRLHVLIYPRQVGEGRIGTTSFFAALGDARSATGRDDNGAIEDEPRSGSWLGAIGYMALLDQIGKSIKPANMPRSEDREGLVLALHHWTDLDEPSIQALYALRCALAHDFSLYNQGRTDRQHLFALDRQDSGSVVRFPITRWTGNFMETSNDMRTWVSLRLFGDLVERVVASVRSAVATNQVEITLEGGAQELFARYTLNIPR